ncbi:MAG: tetratricopeptide repeat protein [Planctomycetota bacterium]|jgi:tetratricopeptide (TPR) repeat protein
MRKKIILFIVIFSLTWPQAQAQINPESGSGRSWPGASRSGLVRSPNPVNMQGNNIVTQNVTGARGFRGNVGYGSPYDFRAQTGSTQLDSFLRRSSGSVITQTPGSYTPYYNRLSSYRPSNPRLTNPYLLNPASTSRLRIDDRASSTSVPSSISNEAKMYRYFGNSRRVTDTTSSYFLNQMKLQQRTTPPQLSQFLMSGEQLTDKQRQILDQQLMVDPKQINDQAPSLKYKEFGDEKSLKSYMRNNLDNDYLQQAQIQKEQIQKVSDKTDKFSEDIEQKDLLLDKQVEDLYQQMGAERALNVKEQQFQQKPRGTQQSKNLVLETLDQQLMKEDSDIEHQEPDIDVIDELGLSSYRTESVIGPDQELSTYMALRSAELILKGGDLLNQQKFYRAADAFTTALIYKEDPKAYAGKCHALFGAGEYMSSSYFLLLALENDPGYIEHQVDIVSAMGGRDVLENRLVDVEKWAQESGSADLHFLRAYFYYRIGRIDMAKEAIDIAHEKMPDSSAVNALKTAIGKKN